MTISRSSFSRPATRLLVVLTFISGLSGGVAMVAAAPPAQAGTVRVGVSTYRANAAVYYARSKSGARYLYGAAGPTRFDCSGLTKWVYGRAGKTIPRTTTLQYRATIRVARANRRPGDLVFFSSRAAGIYHVGIYAGSNRIWHSPRTGDHVRLSIIWTTVSYGRVR
jgi:cell wall-associated NlpC family hydrolase